MFCFDNGRTSTLNYVLGILSACVLAASLTLCAPHPAFAEETDGEADDDLEYVDDGACEEWDDQGDSDEDWCWDDEEDWYDDEDWYWDDDDDYWCDDDCVLIAPPAPCAPHPAFAEETDGEAGDDLEYVDDGACEEWDDQGDSDEDWYWDEDDVDWYWDDDWYGDDEDWYWDDDEDWYWDDEWLDEVDCWYDDEWADSEDWVWKDGDLCVCNWCCMPVPIHRIIGSHPVISATGMSHLAVSEAMRDLDAEPAAELVRDYAVVTAPLFDGSDLAADDGFAFESVSFAPDGAGDVAAQPASSDAFAACEPTQGRPASGLRMFAVVPKKLAVMR